MEYIPFVVFIVFMLISRHFKRKASRYVKKEYREKAVKESFTIIKYPFFHRSDAYVSDKGIKYRNYMYIFGIFGVIILAILMQLLYD
jgi:hypothetical protein